MGLVLENKEFCYVQSSGLPGSMEELIWIHAHLQNTAIHIGVDVSTKF